MTKIRSQKLLRVLLFAVLFFFLGSGFAFSKGGKGNNSGEKGKKKFIPVTLNDPENPIPWLVTYDGRDWDEENDQTTFYYTVEVTGNPALSHFIAGLPVCDDDEIEVDSTYPKKQMGVGVDPTTGLYGIKWDIELDKDDTRTYSYTLVGNIDDSGFVDIGLKAGLYIATTSGETRLPGPSCGGEEPPPPPPPPASISGRVFLDLDEDGELDGNETSEFIVAGSRISGFIFELLAADGTVVDTATTDDDGNYGFSPPDGEGYAIRIQSIEGTPNQQLFIFFTPTSPLTIGGIDLPEDASDGYNFGFYYPPE